MKNTDSDEDKPVIEVNIDDDALEIQLEEDIEQDGEREIAVSMVVDDNDLILDEQPREGGKNQENLYSLFVNFEDKEQEKYHESKSQTHHAGFDERLLGGSAWSVSDDPDKDGDERNDLIGSSGSVDHNTSIDS